MKRIIFLLVLFTVGNTINSHGQHWNWAVKTDQDIEYTDVAIAPNHDIVTLFRDNEREWFISLADSSGARKETHELYFRDSYRDCGFEIDVDDSGFIYLLSRQMLEEENPEPEFKRDPLITDDDEEDDEAGRSSFEYIVLTRFTPRLQELSSMRLLKCDGSGYSIDVCDLEIDWQGNVWFCGRTSNDDFEFKGLHFTPGDAGSDFVVRLQHNALNLGWIKVFNQSGTCCQYGTESNNIAVNKDGVCLFVGSFYGDTKLSNGTVLHAVKGKRINSEMYAVALDGNGIIKWSKRMNAESYDKDVIALSGGNFICAGYFSGANRLNDFNLQKGDTSGFFVASVNATSGQFTRVFTCDTASIGNLHPGVNNDFYSTVDYLNYGFKYYLWHWNKSLSFEKASQFSGDKPCSDMRDGLLVLAGGWSWNCAFGERKPNFLYVGGESSDWGSFMACCNLYARKG